LERHAHAHAHAHARAGLALEIATAIFPQSFLLLASLGNFSKAVGKGMGKPVFRVIQVGVCVCVSVGERSNACDGQVLL
jgi:hypothetical protein